MIVCQDCARIFRTAHALADHRRMTHDNPNWRRAGKKITTKKPLPMCPRCGGAPTFSEGKFGTKAECCGLWSWGLKPLVGRHVHAARIRAHDAFDRLWQSGEMSRGEAYRRLQIATGMSQAECHISLMTADQALRVVEIVLTGALFREPA